MAPQEGAAVKDGMSGMSPSTTVMDCGLTLTEVNPWIISMTVELLLVTLSNVAFTKSVTFPIVLSDLKMTESPVEEFRVPNASFVRFQV